MWRLTLCEPSSVLVELGFFDAIIIDYYSHLSNNITINERRGEYDNY